MASYQSTPLPLLPPQNLPSPLSWSQQPVLLPSSPGVYWFIGAKNEVLYVGKAKNLKSRLKSYSQIKHLLPKTSQLVKKIISVNYQVLNSELEALLIEAELIRTHQPHYNILLKDDKSPLYIIITKATYPQVLSVRRSDLNKYQPVRRIFGPFPSARQVKTVLKLARSLFPYCNASLTDKSKHKACFYYHIKQCPGACTGEITPKDYLSLIRHLELFLAGSHQQIIRQLTAKINRDIKAKHFESAAITKNKIEALTYIFTHYQISQNHRPLPQLTQDLYAEKIISLKHLLAESGLIIKNLHRIEAYDVANIMGQSAAVSMVVTIDGQPDHSQYRHFKIKNFTTPNDVGMLKESIIRRQNHPEWGIPQLIVIDGGKTQLKGVLSVLNWSVPVISIAKHPDRLLIANSSAVITQSLLLDQSLPASQLLMALRDEAHRFSRRLFQKLDLNKLLLVS